MGDLSLILLLLLLLLEQLCLEISTEVRLMGGC